MSTANKFTLTAIIGVIGIFTIVDYSILQSQNLKASIADLAAATPTPTPTPTPPTTPADPKTCTFKHYKFLENTDACKLENYTKKGWEIFQAGTVIESYGREFDCSTASPLSLDWALLTFSSISHSCF